MTVTVAHARLNCVCTDTEATTIVEYTHRQISITSVTRTCL